MRPAKIETDESAMQRQLRRYMLRQESRAQAPDLIDSLRDRRG
jgi:hypothetical protein